MINSLTELSDEQLTAQVIALADGERRATVALISALAEFDARRLYLAAGCSSLFTYCAQVLRLSEHAAYGRIEAARAVRRFPVLLEQLADGSLTLTSVCLLAPHLTTENHHEVLASARHKTKRGVELLVAALRPQPPVPTTIRKLPTPKPIVPTEAAMLAADPEPTAPLLPPLTQKPKRTAVVAPLSPEQYKLQVTVSAETYTLLRRAQDLMRHAVPTGDVSVIIDRALKVFVRQLEQQKFAATDRSRTARSLGSVIRVRSRQTCAGVCGSVMVGSARSSGLMVVAVLSAGFSSFTTYSLMRMVARVWSRMSNYAVVPTMPMKRRGGTERCSRGRSGRCTRSWTEARQQSSCRRAHIVRSVFKPRSDADDTRCACTPTAANRRPTSYRNPCIGSGVSDLVMAIRRDRFHRELQVARGI